MAQRSQERDIRGFTVTVTQFDPFKALDLAPRVWKALAPLLPLLAMRGNPDALKQNISALVPAMNDFCDALIKAGTDLITELISCATIIKESELEEDEPDAKPVKGKKPAKKLQVWDLANRGHVLRALQGRLDLMLEIAYFSAEVNFFRYFFDRIGSKTKEPQPGESASE